MNDSTVEMNDQHSFSESDGSHHEVSLPAAALSLTAERIALLLGYKESVIPAHFHDIIEAVLARLPALCAIRAGYRLVSVARHEKRIDGLLVDGVFFSMQPVITRQLHNAHQAALFVCTIGNASEDWATRLFSQGDAVTGYLVDAIASAAVENATDYLHDQIERQMMKKSLAVTNRFSPGYCGWPVAEQHLLFSRFPHGFCGVCLTDSALMIPKKTVSGIIGIGSLVKRQVYFCNRCENETCIYRTYLKDHTIKGK